MGDKILVVEDDENLRLTLVDNLQLEGYSVESVATLAGARELLQRESVLLTILDVMLPDGSGYDFCQELRVLSPNTRVLMLTARTLNADLLLGFSAGTDDYMTKPYKLDELLARIKALMSRVGPLPETSLHVSCINGFDINWQQRTIFGVSKDSNHYEVHLTKKEFDLLSLLYLNINTPLSREKILNQVWGENLYVEERTVDNFVSNIRKILNLNISEPYFIRTIRGVGYSLVMQNAS